MLSADFQFAQMDLARASLVLIRVLRTLINPIAKNLHKLQICLRFYSFYNKLAIQAMNIKSESFSKSQAFPARRPVFLPGTCSGIQTLFPAATLFHFFHIRF